MLDYLLADTIVVNKWLLYVIMAILIIANILLILYVLLHLSKDQTTKDLVEAARKSKEQPITAKSKNNSLLTDGKYSKYVIEADGKTLGWFVRKKGEKKPIAYAKTKDEATEIAKNLQ